MRTIEQTDYGVTDSHGLAKPIKNHRSGIALAAGAALAIGAAQVGSAGKAEAQETAVYAGAGMGVAAICAANPLLCAGVGAVSVGGYVYSQWEDGTNIVSIDSYRTAPQQYQNYYCRGYCADSPILEDFGRSGTPHVFSEYISAPSISEACYQFESSYSGICNTSCGRAYFGIGSSLNQVPCALSGY